MRTTFICGGCGMVWRYPDLTHSEAVRERRDICPRCGCVGIPGSMARNTRFWLMTAVAIIEAAALVATWIMWIM